MGNADKHWIYMILIKFNTVSLDFVVSSKFGSKFGRQ